jgi:outer membrane protein OmpA-like peptidoglycan-associated protein
MSNFKAKSQSKIEAKRQTELWIYSLADMYMILSVFFIAIAVIYAAKAKRPTVPVETPTAGRGPAAVVSTLSIEFETGSARLTEKAENDLKMLMPVLRGSKGAVEVEGYADGKSLNQDNETFSSNLDLSSTRAVRVAEWLMRNGVAASRVRTSSFGDSRLYKTGPNGIQTNRRVVLKILPVGGG